ncbi:hypothetical protein [Chelativorans sp. Marseille-P2723]|uniref:hypothetical protein n=1 Tax=Chelativorans sp. Marseille-P2723 TaxID=2709133 RepID=UPI00156FBA41|nr:hypothetical protein [Chelativorans sp. Marseille-P2723]
MLGLAFGTWVRIGIGAALIVALGWSHLSAYRAGRSAEQAAFLNQIRQENEHAGKTAEDWRGHYRLCVERGGLFDFETGSCDR